MNRIASHLILLLAAVAAPRAAALSPELQHIKEVTLDPASASYYPRLMARFDRTDTVMTTQEYRTLYLGSIFQEDYNPYRRSVYARKVTPLAHKSTHTRAELDTMIKYTQLVLRDTPFDLDNINFLIYALRARKKFNLANMWQYRLNHLLQAIVSTGTGADTTQAWMLIYPRDEATLVNLRVREPRGLNPTFVKPYYDRIDVTDATGANKAFYFNLQPLLEEFNRKNP